MITTAIISFLVGGFVGTLLTCVVVAGKSNDDE
jgi:hypothetical protein